MKNKLINLNNHLFMQLERLNDENLKGDRFKMEVERGNVITRLSMAVIANAALSFKGQCFIDDTLGDGKLPLMMLED